MMRSTMLSTLFLLLPVAALAQDDEAADEAPAAEGEAAEEDEPKGCDEPFVLIMQAKNDTENFYLAEAQAEIDEALSMYACSKLLDPTLLGQLWQSQGMIHVMNGDAESSKPFFAAAAAVSPDNWNNNFGDDAKKDFVAPTDPPGELNVRGAGKAAIAVDGKLVDVPVDLLPGPHVVQVGKDLPELAEFSKVVVIESGQEQTLMARVSADEQPIAGTLPVAPPPSNGSSIPLAAGGGGALLASGVMVVLGNGAAKRFEATDDFDEAQKFHGQNRAFNYSAIGLGVVGLGLGGVAVITGQW